MENDKNLKKITIKKNVLKNIIAGHPWCFSGALEKIDAGLKNGDLCEIYSNDQFLGIGYFNSNTNIAVRVLTRKKQAINTHFFIERLKSLKTQKEKYLNNTNAYRLCFGESDNLPGLVIDIYHNVIIIQIHTLGMDKLKQFIIDALVSIYDAEMIYEKSALSVRTQEGLEKETNKLLFGKQLNEVDIIENGFKFRVNVVMGQKTGFFLDQRENRLALMKYTKNRNVLNCFCYTGGFSVYSAVNAKSVTSVDISKPAIEQVKINFKLNNLDSSQNKFFTADVFDYLKSLEKGDYDLIILDPPSFAKNKKQLANAIKAYTTINSKALEKLNDHDILVSSSCTTHVDETTFIKILNQCAINTKCQLKVLESKIQPHDHPYNISYPEGRYLKFFILQKYPIL
ncbi:MAG: class I SAM-dependent rRNA methyltransferase [Spirochaetes bacterium]|nr:class I SAM-dependent rRNA methyltransferase [Spirochaetota bacterium]